MDLHGAKLPKSLKRIGHPLLPLFAVEALGSVGGNLLQLGIFFYMQQRFGWGAEKNLLLSSAQGATYIFGALSAGRLSRRLGRVALLRRVQIVAAALALVGFLVDSPWAICAVLLLYSGTLAIQWPALESLVVHDASADELSRRISIYNLAWSGIGAIVIAATGTIIQHFMAGIFLVTLATHLLSAGVLTIWTREPRPSGAKAHIAPEPGLLPKRTLAMRLSRVALPATYAAIYALGAMMPTLRSIRQFPEETRTIVASVWMISRFAAFVLLGLTAWWHTRPRVLFYAAIAMFISFLWTGLWANPTGMIAGQVILGLAMGLIYSGSLYFGMVLSEGSTEHGGYHEAVIGLGAVLGPGAGAIAQVISPGNQRYGIDATAIIIAISVIICGSLSVTHRASRTAG